MNTGVGRQLDPNQRSKNVEDFERFLTHKIIGQKDAIDAVVDIFQMYSAGLNPPFRPIGNLLFLGPTGTGKTRVVEAMAEALFGDAHALIKVDCAEFQHSHEISKLVGSPPGYLGHRETHPIFTQEAINQWHTDKVKLTLILFDEIEKASDALWQLLLGILDKGTLTLGNNHRVDMSCCIIVMTSNIGSESSSNNELGFGARKDVGHIDAALDDRVQRNTLDAARRKFSPEFINRIDKSVVFKTLRENQLEQILNLELEIIQQRILSSANNNRFIFVCSDEVKLRLLREGTDLRYGARHLKRVLERSIVSPLANLVTTGQINMGDLIRITLGYNKFIFTVEAENAVVPVLLEKFKELGLKPAKEIVASPDQSAEMIRAHRKLKEAEERLAEAKAMRRMLDLEK